MEQPICETERITPTTLVTADHPPTVRTPANINLIIAAVVRETKSSSRYVTRDLGLTKIAGLRIFDDDPLHPFYYSQCTFVPLLPSSTEEILRINEYVTIGLF